MILIRSTGRSALASSQPTLPAPRVQFSSITIPRTRANCKTAARKTDAAQNVYYYPLNIALANFKHFTVLICKNVELVQIPSGRHSSASFPCSPRGAKRRCDTLRCIATPKRRHGSPAPWSCSSNSKRFTGLEFEKRKIYLENIQ